MSSSAYPIIWALKHAPVVDAIERAILLAIADHGDADGCDCYPSVGTMAKAALVDNRTAQRRRDGLEARGLIRRQPGPPPARWLNIPPYKRPPVLEVMIPYSWWSDAQREDVNRRREEKGRPPLTPEMRPDLAEAPAKAVRSDKGKKNPKRKRKDSKEASPPVSETGGRGAGDFEAPPVSETPPPLSLRHPTPCLEDTQPSFFNPPVEPSSSYVGAERGDSKSGRSDPKTEEEDRGQHNDKANAVVDDALERWDPQHRRPNRTERAHIAKAVVAALAEGAAPDDIVRELTRDLNPRQVASGAIQVIRYRIKEPGWAKPAAPTSKPTVLRPMWCGACDERTRLRDENGKSRRCPDCHPLAVAS